MLLEHGIHQDASTYLAGPLLLGIESTHSQIASSAADIPSNLPFVVSDPVRPYLPRRQIGYTWLAPSTDIDVQTNRGPISRIDDTKNCRIMSKVDAFLRCD